MPDNDISYLREMLVEIKTDVKDIRKDFGDTLKKVLETQARHDERIGSLERSRTTLYSIITGLSMITASAVVKLIFDAMG